MALSEQKSIASRKKYRDDAPGRAGCVASAGSVASADVTASTAAEAEELNGRLTEVLRARPRWTDGQSECVSRRSCGARDGRLISGGPSGVPVHAGSFLRTREIVLESALLDQPVEFARIFLHELFHFVWLRAGNPLRRSWKPCWRTSCAAARVGAGMVGGWQEAPARPTGPRLQEPPLARIRL